MNARIATAVVGGIAVLGVPAVADAKVTRLTLTEAVTAQVVVVDYPPTQSNEAEPPTAGDIVVGQADLLRGSKKVGRADFMGAITAFPMIAFYGTFTLPGGKVSVVDVADLSASKQTYAIVGGTGRYAGARGTVEETRVVEGRTKDVFTIVNRAL
jgi:hypothetical protein